MEVDKFRFLNVDIDNVKFDEFLKNLQSGFVVTPNADHLIKLQKDKQFYHSYQTADHVVCDSKILMLLSKFLKPSDPIKEQIAGSDLFPAFCDYHKDNTANVKVFLLGGSEASVIAAQEKINAKTNSQIVIGAYSPPFGFDKDPAENQKIIDLINQSGANVLAVGVGAPKQENWIAANRSQLTSVDIFLAIGATIEFEAGGLSRAPKWMTKFGVEWLYRLGQEPGRMFRRYILEDTAILWLLLKQKLGVYRNPWQDQ